MVQLGLWQRTDCQKNASGWEEMAKQVLIVATVGRFLNFEKNSIELLKAKGYEVHCAANWCLDEMDAVPQLQVVRHQIDFARSPLSGTNLTAYRQLKALADAERFAFVHCHTPVGGVLTRLAMRRKQKAGTRILYTAHGFHFFKGAPLKNWLIFYPVEWLCAWWTDVLITINTEDYAFAKRHFHAKKIEYVPGVGIDLEKFAPSLDAAKKKRAELGVTEDEVMLLSVGELSERKNQELVIDALKELNLPCIRYFICGEGAFAERFALKIREYHMESQVTLLGHREDVAALCQAADLFVFPSVQEGLPVALMEAIAGKVPVLCSAIRGNRDLIIDKSCMFQPRNVSQLVKCLQKKMGIAKDKVPDGGRIRSTLKKRTEQSVERAYRRLHSFRQERVLERMKRIYESVEK